MSDLDILFAELLCARLCYFLNDAMSSISSGVAFLSASTPDAQIRSISFLSLKIEDAINKMKFLKYTYGITHHGYETSSDEMSSMINNFLSGTSVSFSMSVLPKSNISLKLAKLIYNMVMIMSEFMLYSGTLSIFIDQKVVIAASYEDSNKDLDPYMLEQSYEIENMNMDNVQYIYTKSIAHAMNYGISLQKNDNQLIITLTPK